MRSLRARFRALPLAICIGLMLALGSVGAITPASDRSLFVLALTVPALADSATITGAEFRAHRPANFFIETYARDKSVCEPVLASLNQPYARKHGPREEQMTLMGPDYLVQAWRKKTVDWIMPSGKAVVWKMGQLVIDINNDGKNDALYRWTSSLRSTISDDVVVSFAPSPTELSEARLSYDEFKGILGPVPEGDVASTGYLELTRKTIDVPDADLPDHGLYWFEVLTIAGKNYLMASDAVYWNSTAVTSVLELKTTRDLKLICQFRGAADIIR